MEAKLLIKSSIADILPAMVKTDLAKLPEEKQAAFVEEFERKKKSVGMAYFFLLICLGMPYGYLGCWGMQWVYWFTGAGCGLWFFYLLFTLAGKVKDYNRDVAVGVMRDLKIMSSN